MRSVKPLTRRMNGLARMPHPGRRAFLLYWQPYTSGAKYQRLVVSSLELCTTCYTLIVRVISRHSPLQNAARKSNPQLYLDPQRVRLDTVERRHVELVLLDTVTARVGDLLPLAILAVEQPPRRGRAAAALARPVVEPVHLHLRHLPRCVELPLDPFFRPLVVPPRKPRN